MQTGRSVVYRLEFNRDPLTRIAITSVKLPDAWKEHI
jgi:hypothetical protein